MTPRPPVSAAWATALAITSGSGVDSTCATEGAVRLHPVSRFRGAGNLEDISQRGYRLARRTPRTRRSPGSAGSQYRRLDAQECSALTRERAPRLSKTQLAVVGIAAVLLIGLLSWPIKYVCPNGPCTSAPVADGYVHRYYEIQPLGAPLIESIVGKKWPLR